jgi:Ca2+-binding RTX toxin-like protein
MAEEQGALVRKTPVGAGFMLEGTWGNDDLRFDASDNPDQIFGFGGDDYLLGNGGDDVIDGGNGNDIIGGGSGIDVLYGGAGDDGISGGSGNDTINGGSGNDTINGDTGRDTINGGSGNDTIDGGDDNDTINGGTGDDYILGGAGNDTITDTSGVDRLKGGSGDDTITVSGGDFFRLDTVVGGSGNDTINVTGTKVIAEGNADNDTFRTDLSRDTVMIGGDGSDRFVITGAHPIGGGRIAEIQGGNAALYTPYAFGVQIIDQVTAGTDTSVDTLDLSQLPGSFGSVTVNLATGRMFDLDGVQLAKITGVENIVGSNASDTLTGNGVANDIRGGAGNDTINGGGGNDTLLGGNGQDTIVGGSGRDRIIGDELTGAASRDTLTGGADADTFVFIKPGQQATDFGMIGTVRTVSIMDRITDFDTDGTDHDFIEVAALLDQSTFAGTTAQQAISQGYLYFVQSGTSTKVMFDVNGGTHGDTANNFAVVELDNIAPADLRPDHFFI